MVDGDELPIGGIIDARYVVDCGPGRVLVGAVLEAADAVEAIEIRGADRANDVGVLGGVLLGRLRPGEATVAKSSRDNFTPDTKLLLAQRAGFRCSNPDCCAGSCPRSNVCQLWLGSPGSYSDCISTWVAITRS